MLLTLPATATRRFIMQKARCHTIRCSNRLQAYGFRNFFTLLFAVLFTFPSRYWFAIGLLRVFSLGGWSRRIHTGFLVSRATQESATLRMASCTGLSPSLERFSKRFHSPSFLRYCSPTTPTMPEHRWFGLFPVRSPLLGESFFIFSSYGY